MADVVLYVLCVVWRQLWSGHYSSIRRLAGPRWD